MLECPQVAWGLKTMILVPFAQRERRPLLDSGAIWLI